MGPLYTKRWNHVKRFLLAGVVGQMLFRAPSLFEE